MIGRGQRQVMYSAAHHANEWITSTLLLKFAEELAQAMVDNGQIGGISARTLAQAASVHLVPMVDPDGVDLVTGALEPATASMSRPVAWRHIIPPFPSPRDGRPICWG